MTAATNPAERQSLWKLLSDRRIGVPSIQRDYAQGRHTPRAGAIRSEFIRSLLSACRDRSNGPLHLDYVYGVSTNDEDSKRCFRPIDGQQRLTTLFLLHWYIARRSGQDDAYNQFRNFAYRVRRASQDFVDEFAKWLSETAGTPVPPKSDVTKSIVDEIRDQTWFHTAWNHDPTISGMLTTLQEIENQTKGWARDDFQSAWDALTGASAAVTFSILAIDQLGGSAATGDEIYIKMNGRGRQLTDWEQFKNWFERHVDDHTSEPETADWKRRLDTEWTDLFWKLKDAENYLVDEEMMRFFRTMAAWQLSVSVDQVGTEVTKVLGTLFGSEFVPMSVYEEGRMPGDKTEDEQRSLFSPDSVNRTFRVLESLRGDGVNRINRALAGLVPDGQGTSETYSHKVFFEQLDPTRSILVEVKSGTDESDSHAKSAKAGKRTVTLPDRVRFLGLAMFLDGKGRVTPENGEALRQWMRLLRNLIENVWPVGGGNDDFARIVGAIWRISRIDGVFDCAYDRLGTDEDTPTQLAESAETGPEARRRQIAEEIEKAKLEARSSDGAEWRREFLRAETHPFFRGKVWFLYKLAEELAGKLSGPNQELLEVFRHVRDILGVVFGATEDDLRVNRTRYEHEDEEAFLFRRALLRAGEFGFSGRSQNWNLVGDVSREGGRNIRYDWFNHVLHESPPQDEQSNQNRECLVRVLRYIVSKPPADGAHDAKHVTERLREYVGGSDRPDEKVPWWRFLLVRYPGLLGYAERKQIRREPASSDETTVVLVLKGERKHGGYRELVTAAIHQAMPDDLRLHRSSEHKKGKKENSQKDTSYQDGRGEEIKPGLELTLSTGKRGRPPQVSVRFEPGIVNGATLRGTLTLETKPANADDYRLTDRARVRFGSIPHVEVASDSDKNKWWCNVTFTIPDTWDQVTKSLIDFLRVKDE